MSVQVIEAYYRLFNARDYPGMLALVADEVVHEINQGEREVGRDRFAVFLERMDRQYRENLTELVVLSEPSGVRFAAERQNANGICRRAWIVQSARKPGQIRHEPVGKSIRSDGHSQQSHWRAEGVLADRDGLRIGSRDGRGVFHMAGKPPE